MKINFFLIILLTGISFYIYNDIYRPDKKSDRDLTFRSLKKVDSIRSRHFHILNKDNQFRFKDNNQILVDEKKVTTYLNFLASLKIERFFTSREKRRLPQNLFSKHSPFVEIIYNANSFKLDLGMPVSYKDGFYVQFNNKVGIAKYLGTPGTVYLKSNLNKKKFAEVFKFLTLKENYFYNLRLFPESSSLLENISQVTINNRRNKPFTLSFLNYTTSPSQISPLGYNEKSFTNFIQKLSKFSGTKILQGQDISKLKSISKIDIDQKIEINLYAKSNKAEKNYYLQNSLYPERILLIRALQATLFFQGHQNFWNKRPLDPESQLKFLSQSPVIRISPLTKIDQQRLLGDQKLKEIKLPSGKYEILKRNSEVQLINRKNKFKIHFQRPKS